VNAQGVVGAWTLSAECTPARQPGYEDAHGVCRQLWGIPLPHSMLLLVVRRCDCNCHDTADMGMRWCS
jgi:hypothetical protein